MPQGRTPTWLKVLVIPWILLWLLVSQLYVLALDGCRDQSCETTLTNGWAILMTAQVLNAIGVALLRNRWAMLLAGGVLAPPLFVLIYNTVVEHAT